MFCLEQRPTNFGPTSEVSLTRSLVIHSRIYYQAERRERKRTAGSRTTIEKFRNCLHPSGWDQAANLLICSTAAVVAWCSTAAPVSVVYGCMLLTSPAVRDSEWPASGDLPTFPNSLRESEELVDAGQCGAGFRPSDASNCTKRRGRKGINATNA